MDMMMFDVLWCFTYFGHKRSYWLHNIFRGLLLSLSLVSNFVTGLQLRCFVNLLLSSLLQSCLHPEHRAHSCGHLSGVKAKPESVMNNNTKYSEDPDQISRAYSVRGGTEDGQWRSSITSSSLTWLGWMIASYSRSTSSRKTPEESPAAAGRGAECRIHGGKSGRGSRHKVGSSGSNHRSSSRHRDSAGPKELQTEPYVGHLKCHKPVHVNCSRRAEVMCGDCDQWSQRFFVCFKISLFPAFSILIIL